MANEPTAPAAPQGGETAVETSVSRNRSLSLTMETGERPAKPVLTTIGDEGSISRYSGNEDAEAAELEVEVDPDTEEAAEAPSDQDAPEADPEIGELVDLGEYKPDDPASVAAFEAAYTTEDGGLNMARLSAEFWKNRGASPDGTLNAGTFKYIEAALGVPESDLKDICEGLAAKQTAEVQQLTERAGGAERLQSAIAWATKAGGYTKAQQAKFNAVMNGRDADAKAEQVDLLTHRFGAATGQTKRRGLRPQKAPVATPASATAAEGITPYSSWTEWDREYREARKTGKNAEMARVRKRLAVSPWHKNGGNKA